MAYLTIVHSNAKSWFHLPHKILINNQFVGIMKVPEIHVELPENRYLITIQSMFPFLYASQVVVVRDGIENRFAFRDREGWWDVLFAIDIVLWLAKIIIVHFFPNLTAYFPDNWELIYDVVTNGYFILWLIYEWAIRKKYFKLSFEQRVR